MHCGVEADAESGRTRLCAVTREELPLDRLIRFVASPDDRIVADLACRLPGRGVWVTADRTLVAKAVKTKAFARSLKRAVSASEELPQDVERLLRQRLTQSLALANKAGLVTTGFTKVDEAVAGGKVAILIHACDAAEDGMSKLDRKFAAVNASIGLAAGARRIDRALSAAELSLALGRTNVVHAAVAAGGAADRYGRESERLERYLADLTYGSRQSAKIGGSDHEPLMEGNTE